MTESFSEMFDLGYLSTNIPATVVRRDSLKGLTKPRVDRTETHFW